MNIHIVFDLDGTLTDTQGIHQQIEADFLKMKGVEITPEMIGVKYAWRTPKEWIPEVLQSEHIDFTQEEVNAFVDQKDKIISQLLKEWRILLMPGAFETITYLYNKGYKLGVSSWSTRELIDELLSYFWLNDSILVSTSANEVERKKPHPDVFLASFKKIQDIYGVPDQKYVIGDGWSDMEWWHKAWAKTIRLNYLNKKKVNDSYCDREIVSLEELQKIL